MSDQKSLTKQQLLMYEIAVYRLLDGSTAQQELQIPQKMRHYTTVHTTTFMRRCAV